PRLHPLPFSTISFLLFRPHPRSTLFPYTTLFRSTNVCSPSTPPAARNVASPSPYVTAVMLFPIGSGRVQHSMVILQGKMKLILTVTSNGKPVKQSSSICHAEYRVAWPKKSGPKAAPLGKQKYYAADSPAKAAGDCAK